MGDITQHQHIEVETFDLTIGELEEFIGTAMEAGATSGTPVRIRRRESIFSLPEALYVNVPTGGEA